MEPGESFFSRWSKRKQEERAGKPLAEPELAKPTATLPDATGKAAGLAGAVPPLTGALEAQQPTRAEPSEAQKLPTLEDTQTLTPESDFKPFMARGVTPEVKNAAMKKLFADPHFNVMDRLDIYIDDYSLPDPLPESMLRKMASAKFLKLFDDDEEEGKTHAGAEASADVRAQGEALASSGPPAAAETPVAIEAGPGEPLPVESLPVEPIAIEPATATNASPAENSVAQPPLTPEPLNPT